MSELVGLDAFIFSTLTGDATLTSLIGGRVYADFAPRLDPATGNRPVFPLVIFTFHTGRDVIGLGAQRIFSSVVMNLKVVGDAGGYAALQSIYNRVDALLKQTSPVNVTIGGVTYTLLGAHRESPFQYAEQIAEVRYSHLGGLYRFMVQPA